MLWYGPGYIKAQPPIERPVTLAGIAPTQGEILDYPFKPIDGQPMTEAMIPASARTNPKPPKLLVTMVWDAGGMNTLRAHPTAWPYLKSLIPQGTSFAHATVGSSPTSTAQDHATIGTGAFPDHHGLVGHHFRIDGTMTSPWNDGPSFFILPTFADLYDRAMDNKPVVGLVGTVDIHFGMLGHGSFFGGGDRDIALTRSVTGGATLTDEGFEWNLPLRDAPYYELPTYANDVPGLKADIAKLDRQDGKLDGKWRDNDIEQLLKGFDTPARTPYQERVVETVIQQEGFGKDATPDLLFLNFKEIDYVSHVWSMNSPEMNDAVVAQDPALKRFVAFLNARGRQGQVGDGAHRGSRGDARSSGLGRLPDLHRRHPEPDRAELRRERSGRAGRRPRAAQPGVPEHGRAAGERAHRGGRRTLRHDAHAGTDRRRRGDARSRVRRTIASSRRCSHRT